MMKSTVNLSTKEWAEWWQTEQSKEWQKIEQQEHRLSVLEGRATFHFPTIGWLYHFSQPDKEDHKMFVPIKPYLQKFTLRLIGLVADKTINGVDRKLRISGLFDGATIFEDIFPEAETTPKIILPRLVITQNFAVTVTLLGEPGNEGGDVVNLQGRFE